MAADTPPPEEEIRAHEAESGMSILQFLAENRPTAEDETARPSETRLTAPLRRKLRDYEGLVRDEVPDISEESLDRLAGYYARELEVTLQDNRPYVDLANRAYATGRMSEEIVGALLAVPAEQEPTMDDLDRVARIDIDLDEFKTYNDFYGHAAGDDVLRRLSTILRNGETIQWLQNESGALPERNENQPAAVEFTSEGGEEFGGLVTFREGMTVPEREQIMGQFTTMLQDEIHTSLQEMMAQTGEDGQPMYTLQKAPPEDIALPENFVMETGASIGYASMKDVASNITIDDDESYFSLVNKIKAEFFKHSDSQSAANKGLRAEARWQSDEGSNARLTAEMSQRGRAEHLKRENARLAAENEQLQAEVQKLKAQLVQ